MNNDEPELHIEVVLAEDEQSALRNYLANLFDFDDKDGYMGNDMVERMLRDELFAVAETEVGNVEFTFYYNLKSLGVHY